MGRFLPAASVEEVERAAGPDPLRWVSSVEKDDGLRDPDAAPGGSFRR